MTQSLRLTILALIFTSDVSVLSVSQWHERKMNKIKGNPHRIPSGSFLCGLCMFSQYSFFLPQYKSTLHRLFGVSKLSLRCEWECVCLSVLLCTGKLCRMYSTYVDRLQQPCVPAWEESRFKKNRILTGFIVFRQQWKLLKTKSDSVNPTWLVHFHF